MKHFCLFSSLLLGLLLCESAQASTMSYAGSFTSDDEVLLIPVQVMNAGTVTLRTFGYAGGVDAAGDTISAGGFDPVLTLYDANGSFLVTNDDGPCGVLAADPTTGNCFDAYVSLALGAGSYTLALTEADNLPAGDLSDGFTQVGNGDFTCQEFLGQPGAFCDASPSQRDANYEVDVTTPGGKVSPTPEPASFVLLLTGCLLLICQRRRLQAAVHSAA